MKYIEEYRDVTLVKRLLNRIYSYNGPEVSFMEVCGGHTMAIRKFGIPALLPPQVHLVSGPGCPVCVTSQKFVDHAVALSRMDEVIVATYGDLIRVPGSSTSLEERKASGADIRMVYSTLEALNIARRNPGKEVVFLGIGFETTAPASAAALKTARRESILNFSILSAHKIMPPAMAAIVDENIKIDGYIGPGHVSAITGSGIFQNLSDNYKLPVVISGFEPLDIIQTIMMLLFQIQTGKSKVEIQYKRVVKPEGNLKALSLLKDVFMLRDDWWRGLGVLKDSGLGINRGYSRWDAEQKFSVETEPTREPNGCICGEVLKGVANPKICPLYGKACTPTNPVGACMVSEEGACQASYRYEKN